MAASVQIERDEFIQLLDLQDAALQMADRIIADAEEKVRFREALKYYANENVYWEITDGGKCHTMTNADQGEKARKALRLEES